MQLPIETLPPPMVVAIVATVVWAVAAMVLGLPLVRAWVRRIEKRDTQRASSGVEDRLARIERAVDSIAVEVERISESQRFLVKTQAERGLPPGTDAVERAR